MGLRFSRSEKPERNRYFGHRVPGRKTFRPSSSTVRPRRHRESLSVTILCQAKLLLCQFHSLSSLVSLSVPSDFLRFVPPRPTLSTPHGFLCSGAAHPLLDAPHLDVFLQSSEAGGGVGRRAGLGSSFHSHRQERLT